MKEHGAGRGARLDRTRRRLEAWRRQHGGRGRRIAEDLWAEAVQLAAVEGVGATARALRLDARCLARRMVPTRAPEVSDPPGDAAPSGFVEIDAGGLCPPVRTVVRLSGSDGERVEVELGAVGAFELVELARAFWSRGR